jgi:hypothetical protein
MYFGENPNLSKIACLEAASREWQLWSTAEVYFLFFIAAKQPDYIKWLTYRLSGDAVCQIGFERITLALKLVNIQGFLDCSEEDHNAFPPASK